MAKHMRPRPGIAALVAAMALAATACTAGGSEQPMNTITQQQANKRTEQYIRDVVSVISPPPRLEPLSHEEAGDCSDPTDNSAKGRVIANRSHWLRDVPKTDNPAVIDTVLKWWTDHNFTIITDDRPTAIYVQAENKTDGFRMYLRESVQGGLTLGATSPCGWPNGTPEPKP
jgi:hypothetical protein